MPDHYSRDELNAAYRAGQEDMRRRIIKQWAGWFTNGLSGQMRMSRWAESIKRTGKQPPHHADRHGDVGLIIRCACKVRDFNEAVTHD